MLVLKVDRLGALDAEGCKRVCGGLFARVLFPTDFSDAAEHALGRVDACCRMGGAVLVLVGARLRGRAVTHSSY